METTIEFKEFKLNASLLSTLENAGFQKASPIQELIINQFLREKIFLLRQKREVGKQVLSQFQLSNKF